MDTKALETVVTDLCEKANKMHDGGDAMKFSQAALNAANALCSLKSAAGMVVPD